MLSEKQYIKVHTQYYSNDLFIDSINFDQAPRFQELK